MKNTMLTIVNSRVAVWSIVVLLMLVYSAMAQTVYDWDDGAGNNLWSAAANWSPDGTPGASDSITQTAVTGAYLRVDGSDRQVASWSYNSSSGFDVVGDSVTTARTLTITGDFTKSGSGTFNFRNSTGALSVNLGSLTLNAGALNFGASATTSLSSVTVTGVTSIASGAILGFNAVSSTLANVSIAGSGILTVNNTTTAGSSRTVTIGPLSSSSTTAKVGGARTSTNNLNMTATLIINTGGGAAVYAGQIVDNTSTGTGNTLALVKTGAGSQTLSGTNSYTGGTSITGGALIAANASALGTGATTINGGTLSSSISNLNLATLALTSGVLSINDSSVGTFTLTSGSGFSFSGGTWLLTLNSSASYDQIIGSSSETFSINGGILDLTGSTINYGTTYTVLSGFASGSVSNLSITGYDSTLYAATLDANGVLSFALVPEPSTTVQLLSSVVLLAMLLRLRQGRCGAVRVPVMDQPI